MRKRALPLIAAQSGGHRIGASVKILAALLPPNRPWKSESGPATGVSSSNGRKFRSRYIETRYTSHEINENSWKCSQPYRRWSSIAWRIHVAPLQCGDRGRRCRPSQERNSLWPHSWWSSFIERRRAHDQNGGSSVSLIHGRARLKQPLEI